MVKGFRGTQNMSTKQSRATMLDVAREAGVSMATVSHVLNATRYVSPDTVEQVREAIAKTKYTPNSLARALATNSTSTIGLVVSWKANPYFSDIISAIETECFDSGISVLLSDSNDNPEKELQIIQDLHERRVDGIFLAPTPDPEQRSVEYLLSNKVVAVLIDRKATDKLDYVGIQNANAMVLLVDHMVGHGARNIAFVPGHRDYETTEDRTQAFKKQMAHHKLGDTAVVSNPVNSTIEADETVFELVSKNKEIEAIITGNNLSTIGAMRALRRLGMSVPKDMRLIGIDDFEWADSFEPRLSVIAQPCEQIGKNAVKLMKERLSNADLEPRHIELEPSLVIRNSCGCR